MARKHINVTVNGQTHVCEYDFDTGQIFCDTWTDRMGEPIALTPDNPEHQPIYSQAVNLLLEQGAFETVRNYPSDPTPRQHDLSYAEQTPPGASLVDGASPSRTGRTSPVIPHSLSASAGGRTPSADGASTVISVQRLVIRQLSRLLKASGADKPWTDMAEQLVEDAEEETARWRKAHDFQHSPTDATPTQPGNLGEG